jgi:hypothetical protein
LHVKAPAEHLAQVLIAEADAFVAQWKDWKLPDGRDRVVRHGHGPERTIQALSRSGAPRRTCQVLLEKAPDADVLNVPENQTTQTAKPLEFR